MSRTGRDCSRQNRLRRSKVSALSQTRRPVGAVLVGHSLEHRAKSAYRLRSNFIAQVIGVASGLCWVAYISRRSAQKARPGSPKGGQECKAGSHTVNPLTIGMPNACRPMLRQAQSVAYYCNAQLADRLRGFSSPALARRADGFCA